MKIRTCTLEKFSLFIELSSFPETSAPASTVPTGDPGVPDMSERAAEKRPGKAQHCSDRTSWS